MLCGCKTQSNFVVMASATTVGFDVSYNGVQPQATLAFKRAEVEFVPVTTNYTPDTLMEFRFNSTLTTQEIYSRMATGPHATISSPAILMMAKDRHGSWPTNWPSVVVLPPQPTTNINK